MPAAPCEQTSIPASNRVPPAVPHDLLLYRHRELDDARRGLASLAAHPGPPPPPHTTLGAVPWERAQRQRVVCFARLALEEVGDPADRPLAPYFLPTTGLCIHIDTVPASSARRHACQTRLCPPCSPQTLVLGRLTNALLLLTSEQPHAQPEIVPPALPGFAVWRRAVSLSLLLSACHLPREREQSVQQAPWRKRRLPRPADPSLRRPALRTHTFLRQHRRAKARRGRRRRRRRREGAPTARARAIVAISIF